MKIYKKILLMLCLLSASTSLYAANDEAQFNFIKKTYTINSDMSYSTRVVKEIKLLTHTSFNSLYGETFVVYNPLTESLKINECYTIQADGTKVAAPQNAFNEVLPAFAVSDVRYNHLKEMVITHTGLEIGATIYLDYTIASKAVSGVCFDLCQMIEESSPVKEYSISFDVASGVEMQYSLKRSAVKPQIKGSTTTYTFKNVAASTLESLKPQNGSAAVLLATGYKAGDFAGWLSAQMAQNEDVLALMGEPQGEAIDWVLNFVNNRLATSATPMQYAENKVDKCSDFVAAGCATQIEKVLLLEKALKATNTPHKMLVQAPCYVDANTLTCNNFKAILFEVGGKYYSVFSTHPIDLSGRASLDKFYEVQNGKFSEVKIESTKSVNNTYIQEVTKEMTKGKNYLVMTPEGVNSGVRNWAHALPTKRTAPVELPYLANETSVWTIALKDDMELGTDEFTKTLKMPFGELQISLDEEDDVVTLKRSIKFTTQKIAAKDYKKFREFMTVWNSALGAKLLFEVD